MSVKDESKAGGRKAGAAPAARTEADGEDIARLLRALNDDLKLDSADEYDPDTLDEEPEAKAERRLPVGMIAVALLAAMGIGFGVVLFDREYAGLPQTASQTAATGAATGASTAEPQPLIARPDLAPQAASAPKPAATAAAPTPVLTPVPMPAPVPAPAGNAPAAAVPAPAAGPAAPVAAAPIRIPEPPRLPEPAAQAAHQAPKPAAPPARLAEAPPPAPSASAPPAAGATASGTAAPAPAIPKAARPAAAPAAAPTTPAPAATVETGGEAEGGALQAMLAPPEPAGPGPGAPIVQPAAPSRTVTGQAPAGRGRYAIQVGSFQMTENADALVRRLQASGLEAYALNWTDSAQRTWRVVRVGHYASSEEAQRAVGGLQGNIGGLTPIVVGTR